MIESASPPLPTPSTAATSAALTEVRAQLAPTTPDIVLEAIVHHLVIFREARRRIAEEGIVVRDMRGSVVAHPALDVAKVAAKELETMTARWKRANLADGLAGLAGLEDLEHQDDHDHDHEC